MVGYTKKKTYQEDAFALRYLVAKSTHLVDLVTDPDKLAIRLPLVNLRALKYRVSVRSCVDTFSRVCHVHEN